MAMQIKHSKKNTHTNKQTMNEWMNEWAKWNENGVRPLFLMLSSPSTTPLLLLLLLPLLFSLYLLRCFKVNLKFMKLFIGVTWNCLHFGANNYSQYMFGCYGEGEKFGGRRGTGDILYVYGRDEPEIALLRVIGKCLYKVPFNISSTIEHSKRLNWSTMCFW